MDEELSEDCHGVRLEEEVLSKNDSSKLLFRKYHEQYSFWRDNGIQCARNLLRNEKKSVYILGLDIEQYFYRINIDFEALGAHLHSLNKVDHHSGFFESPHELGRRLLTIVAAICKKYNSVIRGSLQITHPTLQNKGGGLPIGIYFSPLLANWYLRNFDKKIRETINPSYYGRYVDDILLVMPAVSLDHGDPIRSFMDRFMVEPGLLSGPDSQGVYDFVAPEGLRLRKSKCILQYFDERHSIAGLEKFKKKLEENASDFLLLPEEDSDGPLDAVAYDLLYEGSVNKFRSVKGVAENKYELAKHLARETLLELVAVGEPDQRTRDELVLFFKGKNALEFHDLWERVLSYFVVAHLPKYLVEFKNRILEEIDRIEFSIDSVVTNPTQNDKISSRLRMNLSRHLELSQEMALALNPFLDEGSSGMTEKEPSPISQATFHMLRESNMIRHHFVILPLLNYTGYEGDLTVQPQDFETRFDPKKLEYSPRFIHIDELMSFYLSSFRIHDGREAFERSRKVFERVNGVRCEGVELQKKS